MHHLTWKAKCKVREVDTQLEAEKWLWWFCLHHICLVLFAQPLSARVVKNPPANAGDTGDAGSILGSGRSPGGENGNPLQYSCLENSMDRGAWRALVDGLAKSWTGLSTSTKFISNVFSPNHFLFPGPTHSQSDAEWCWQTHSRSHLLPYFRASNVHVRLYPEGFCVCWLQGSYF